MLDGVAYIIYTAFASLRLRDATFVSISHQQVTMSSDSWPPQLKSVAMKRSPRCYHLIEIQGMGCEMLGPDDRFQSRGRTEGVATGNS